MRQYIQGLLAGTQFSAVFLTHPFPLCFLILSLNSYVKGSQKSCPISLKEDFPSISILHEMLSVLRHGCVSPYVDSLGLFPFNFLRYSGFITSSNAFDPAKELKI